jgi:hypothetical protein
MTALKKVQPGDALKIPASTFNTFIDAARDFQQRTRHLGQQATPTHRSAGIVLVRNESGYDRDRFDVLAVSGSVFTPSDLDAFKNDVVLTGATPTAGRDDGKFVILQEPLEDGAIGRAVLSGVTPVRIDVANADHQFADVADNDATKLISADHGEAQILWKETGTGLKWALVRLGNVGAPRRYARIEQHFSGPDLNDNQRGVYKKWTQVEPITQPDNTAAWAPVIGGLTEADGLLFEINGRHDVPVGAVVEFWSNPKADTEPAFLFEYAPDVRICHGRDDLGAEPYSAENLTLTVTDPNGNDLLDENGDPYTYSVARNLTGFPRYIKAGVNMQYTFLRFPLGDSHANVLLEVEPPKDFHQVYAPQDVDDAFRPGGAPLIPPAAGNISGDPSNADHKYCTGWLYPRTVNGEEYWGVWTVLDPSGIAADIDTPDAWLDDNLVGNTTQITHETWDYPAGGGSEVGPILGNVAVGGGDIETGPADPGMDAYIKFDTLEDRIDGRSHSEVTPLAADIYVGLNLYKVKADAADTGPSYLIDAISFEPVDACLESAVDPGGAANNTVKLTHKDWDAARKDAAEDVLDLVQFLDIGNRMGLSAQQPDQPEGKGWLKFKRWNYERDKQGHCDLSQTLEDDYYAWWWAVPAGAALGDILYWDNEKWVTLAAPGEGDFVLMSSGGAPYWQEVKEFECPCPDEGEGGGQ